MDNKDTTQITDTKGLATADHLASVRLRKAAAQAKALECLQKMCAEDKGHLTITPSGWRFAFARPEVKP